MQITTSGFEYVTDRFVPQCPDQLPKACQLNWVVLGITSSKQNVPRIWELEWGASSYLWPGADH